MLVLWFAAKRLMPLPSLTVASGRAYWPHPSTLPDDPDVFLETIGLSETRAYVELVLEHYARYRYAYGLAEGPGLSLP